MYKFITDRKLVLNILLIIFLVISYFVWFITKNYYDLSSKNYFESESSKFSKNIQNRMLVYENALRGGVAFYQARKNITRNEWRDFVQNIEIKKFYPGIQGLGITLMLKEEEIKPLEDSIQSYDYPSFKFKPVGNRDQYSAIIYLEPLDKRNVEAIGYDMFSETTRRKAMEIARDTGLPTISSRVTLLQEIDSDVQAGTLMYLPLYKKNLPLNTIEDRRKALTGYVYSAFRMNDLIAPAVTNDTKMNIEIYDGEKLEKNLLFRSSNLLLNKGSQIINETLNVGGRKWNIYEYSTRELDSQINSSVPNIIAILSVLVSFLIYTVFIILYNNRKNLENQVYIRTKELKVTNLLLDQKKKELETIIQETPSPIMIHNEDGKVLMVNKIWEILTGYKYKDIDTIEKWTYLAYGKRMPIIKEYFDNLFELEKKVDLGQYDIITENGKIITWQFGSAPLGIIDGKRTVITSAMDITELKQKDEMLINQSRHAAMGEMIGMIAHQWRQPISSITMDANGMLMDIALENLNTTKAEKYVKQIHKQTQYLSSTIDDFSNYFKPDKMVSEVSIKEIVDSTLSIVKNSLQNNKIELTTYFETDKKVKAHPRELMQVFVNIINNSKDALKSNMSKGALIGIRVYEDEKYVITKIYDNGGGINVDILPKVFDPYFSTKHEKSGTGLGLYMSKMIIEKHLGGNIEVYNKDNGVCFVVKLLKQ